MVTRSNRVFSFSNSCDWNQTTDRYHENNINLDQLASDVESLNVERKYWNGTNGGPFFGKHTFFESSGRITSSIILMLHFTPFSIAATTVTVAEARLLGVPTEAIVLYYFARGTFNAMVRNMDYPLTLFHCCGATVLIRCISVSTSFHLSSFPVNMVIFPPSHLGGSVCFHFIMSVNLGYSVCSAHSVYFTTGSDDCLADFFLCLSFFCHFLLRRNAWIPPDEHNFG